MFTAALLCLSSSSNLSLNRLENTTWGDICCKQINECTSDYVKGCLSGVANDGLQSRTQERCGFIAAGTYSHAEQPVKSELGVGQHGQPPGL